MTVPRSSKQLARQHVRAGHGVGTSCTGLSSGAKDSATQYGREMHENAPRTLPEHYSLQYGSLRSSIMGHDMIV